MSCYGTGLKIYNFSDTSFVFEFKKELLLSGWFWNCLKILGLLLGSWNDKNGNEIHLKFVVIETQFFGMDMLCCVVFCSIKWSHEETCLTIAKVINLYRTFHILIAIHNFISNIIIFFFYIEQVYEIYNMESFYTYIVHI